MTDAQFRITVASDDTTPVVVAAGDIDLANVADFAVAATTELTMIVAATGPIKTLLGISGLDRVAAVVTME